MDRFSTARALLQRRVSVMAPLGFASGLPLALTSGTLQAWLTVAGVDIRTIGALSLVGIPYTVKFLWSPFMDRYALPFLGRRRGWLATTQLALLFGIALMSALSPNDSIWILSLVALCVAFLSASQDIAFDAYRADALRPAERGLGAALSVIGYRGGMLASGALALMLAEAIGWQGTYFAIAGLMGIGLLATGLGREPELTVQAPDTLSDAVRAPIVEFIGRERGLAFLVLIVLYKLGDALAGTLTTAFVIGGLGFSLSEVAYINKGIGLGASLIGVFWGGVLMLRWGIYRSLFLFGVLQAVTNLGFCALAWVGKSYLGLVSVVALENLCGGMGTAAFVALLMGLCDHRFTATQYALLSAVAGLGRVVVGPSAGFAVAAIGWTGFFALTFIIALPALALLVSLKSRIQGLNGAT